MTPSTGTHHSGEGREGRREGGREGGREERREGGKEDVDHLGYFGECGGREGRREGRREGGKEGSLACACYRLGDLAQDLFRHQLVKNKGPPEQFVLCVVARGVNEAGKVLVGHLGGEGGKEGGRVW